MNPFALVRSSSPRRSFVPSALVVVAAALLAGCSSGTSTDSTNNGNAGTGGGTGGGGGGGGSPGGAFASTYFADGTDTLTGAGDYVARPISVAATTTFVFRLTSDYQVQASIFPANQLASFASGAGFSGYGSFNNTVGTTTVTLPAGAYYVGARSSAQASVRVRFELDRVQTLSGGQYAGAIKAGTGVLPSGGKRWDGFTIQSGSRYWIDGCNSGLDAYVIGADQLGAFQAGGSFLQYGQYGGPDSADLYGGIELELPPGNYYLAQFNRSSVQKTVTYTIERWIGAPAATIGQQSVAVQVDEPQDVPPLSASAADAALAADGFVGAGCAADGLPPALAVSATTVGEVVQVRAALAGAAPSQPALLVVGFRAAPLLDLGLGADCWIHPVPASVVDATTAADGTAEVTLPFARAAFAGRELFLQWILPPSLDGSGRGMATSAARSVRL